MLIGMTVGMNLCNNLIFLTSNASSRKVSQVGILIQQVAYTGGGVWINFLAYLLLEKMGWREFLLVSSLPVFIPPLVILQFFIKETQLTGAKIPVKDENSAVDAESTVKKEEQSVKILQNDVCKIGILSCFGFITLFQGYGSILLAPSIIRSFNTDENTDPYGQIGEGVENTLNCDPCENIVKGMDFLILTAINGATNVLGRIIGWYIHGRFSFRIIQSIFSLGLVICYIFLMVPYHNLAMPSILMGTIKLVFSIQLTELTFVSAEPSIYGKVLYSTGCAIIWGFGHLGSAIGTAFAAFLDPGTAVVIALTLSSIKVVSTTLLDIKII